MELAAAAAAAQKFLQLQGGAAVSWSVFCRFALDLHLHLLEHCIVDHSGIPVPASIARILQQALDLVLVPDRHLLAVRDTIAVQDVRYFLVGKARVV